MRIPKSLDAAKIFNLIDWGFFAFVSLATLFISLNVYFIHWDSLAYHLPFAARLHSIYSADQFVFSPDIQDRYDGFPLLVEWLQGFFWSIFNNVGAAILVQWIALASLVVYLKIRLKIPIIFTALFTFSLPLVFIQYFSDYTDLFASTFLSIGFIAIYFFHKERRVADLLVALTSLAIANNSKYTVLVFVLLAFVSLLATVIFFFDKTKRKAQLVCVVCFVPLIFFTEIKNSILFMNPVYPQKPPIVSAILKNYKTDVDTGQVPDSLKGTAQGVLFLRSFFEVGAYDSQRPQLWTIDQGSVAHDSTGFRMGGFFYVNILLWIILASAVAFFHHGKKEENRRILFGIVLLGIIVSVFPQSHELRYWSFFPILLVVFLLRNLCDRSSDAMRKLLYITIPAQCMVLLYVSWHLTPLQGNPFPPYESFDVAALSSSKNVCLYGIENKDAFLYRLSTKKDILVQFSLDGSQCKYSPLYIKH